MSLTSPLLYIAGNLSASARLTKTTNLLMGSMSVQERQHGHNTRHGTRPAAPRLALIESSWRYRVVADMRRMPRELLDMPVGGSKDKAYRDKLRAWVISDTQ